MIDTEKYEGHIEGQWSFPKEDSIRLEANRIVVILRGDSPRELMNKEANAKLIADAPLILQALIEERVEVKRLRVGIRNILSDYDITELIRDVPEDEWNFEQQALVRMKELIE